MFKPTARILALVGLLLAVTSVNAQKERLMAIGGGARPPFALTRFIQWAGSEKATLLIITWASGEAEASFAAAAKEFQANNPAAIIHAPTLPLDSAKRAQFLEQLKSATGIYFTGGDQNRVMDVLDQDSGLKRALLAKYHAGTPFGGTSAGTAILTSPMITGEGDFTVINGSQVKTRLGLDLLPGVIMDQHFIKRQRQNRLFGLIWQHQDKLGLGIDEGAALLIIGNRTAEVIGTSQIMMVDGRAQPGALNIRLLSHGDILDLRTRRITHGRKVYPKQ